MAYADFTLQTVESLLGVGIERGDLFPGVEPAGVPGWLTDQLRRGMRLPLVSEKSRSELIVMPILLACREQCGEEVAIFSGSRLDVSTARGLVGECDFLLARTPSVPVVRSPLLAVVEAKKGDIEAGLGRCLAQMVGARDLNERDGRPLPAVHGCVTTGEDWQFLRLKGSTAEVDGRRYYLTELGVILGILAAIVRTA